MNLMRVRPKHTRSTRRDRASHPVGRPAARTQPEPPAPDRSDERRARASGGPVDNAQYTCGCGMVFTAAVSTSVACPHCGGGQAW